MSAARRAPLTERQLSAWADDLRGREEALARDLAAFQRHVQRFERCAEMVVDMKARDLFSAMEIVKAAFPAGVTFAPRDATPHGTVH